MILMLYFETSERSDSINIVKQELETSRLLKFIEFEGYTVSEQKVTLLLDRAKWDSSEMIYPKQLHNLFTKLLGEQYEWKKNFAHKLNTRWYFVVYKEDEKSIVIDMLNDGKEIARFNTFEGLAKWTLQFRQYRMMARYEEDGLPQIDVKMREAGVPWPGNLDKALCVNGQVVALIEYQKTARDTVENHDNNKYFKNTYSWGYNEKFGRDAYNLVRKGDEFRWKVIDEFSKQANVPLLVIVWSDTEDCVALKLVNSIVYTRYGSEEANTNAGIKWGEIRYCKISEVDNNISQMLGL